MKDEILFFERQFFGRTWIVAIALISVNLLVIFGFFSQNFSGGTWINLPTNNWEYALFIVIMLFVNALLFVEQRTVITKEGIFVRYFPLDFKTRFFDWNEIQNAYIRQYNPMLEYGGWGFRHQFFSTKNVVYNVSGNIGLQLVFKNGTKVLIGTKKWVELEEVLTKLNDKRK